MGCACSQLRSQQIPHPAPEISGSSLSKHGFTVKRDASSSPERDFNVSSGGEPEIISKHDPSPVRMRRRTPRHPEHLSRPVRARRLAERRVLKHAPTTSGEKSSIYSFATPGSSFQSHRIPVSPFAPIAEKTPSAYAGRLDTAIIHLEDALIERDRLDREVRLARAKETAGQSLSPHETSDFVKCKFDLLKAHCAKKGWKGPEEWEISQELAGKKDQSLFDDVNFFSSSSESSTSVAGPGERKGRDHLRSTTERDGHSQADASSANHHKPAQASSSRSVGPGLHAGTVAVFVDDRSAGPLGPL